MYVLSITATELKLALKILPMHFKAVVFKLKKSSENRTETLLICWKKTLGLNFTTLGLNL